MQPYRDDIFGLYPTYNTILHLDREQRVCNIQKIHAHVVLLCAIFYQTPIVVWLQKDSVGKSRMIVVVHRQQNTEPNLVPIPGTPNNTIPQFFHLAIQHVKVLTMAMWTAVAICRLSEQPTCQSGAHINVRSWPVQQQLAVSYLFL